MIADVGQGIGAVAILVVPVVLIYLWQEHGRGGRWKTRFNRWVDAGGLLQYKKKPPARRPGGGVEAQHVDRRLRSSVA